MTQLIMMKKNLGKPLKSKDELLDPKKCNELDLLARVIYGEYSTDDNGTRAVALAIYNRYKLQCNRYGKDYRKILNEKDFSCIGKSSTLRPMSST